MTQDSLVNQIKLLPKLELHIHLEGCISLSYVEQRTKTLGIDLPRPLDDFFPTGDLSEFLKTLDWVCSLVHTEEDAFSLAQTFGRYCQEQNIVYCEVIVNPTHWGNIHFDPLLSALASGFDEIYEELDLDIAILPSILRQQSAQEAMQLAEWVVDRKHPRIIGISVDGNEQAAGKTGQKFAPAFKHIRENGLFCTAHAGESSGAEGVRSALDELRAHRLDHGVRVIEDEQLSARVVQEQVPLNVCVSSNCHVLYKDIGAHPFLELQEKGVLMTLNTDDPVVLKTSLVKELTWVSEHFGLSLEQLVQYQRNAVTAAFCDIDKKTALLARLDNFSGEIY